MRKPDAQKQVASDGPSREKEKVPLVLLYIFLAGVLIVISGCLYDRAYRVAWALIWGLGFCVSGMLFGFLFGILRNAPGAAIAVPPEASSAAVQGSSLEQQANGGDTLPLANAQPMQSEINSNLVEVSDWLTKVIVGVGLVELKALPAGAQSVAEFIAPSLGLQPISAATPVAGGIMLFFSVLGFLIGYLMTRIYLGVLIKWADNQVIIQNRPIRLESGKEIEVDELTRLQQTALVDLQETVAHLVLATPQTMTASAAEAEARSAIQPARGRVLWVDDNPNNNTLLVEQLTREGALVEQVTSSALALKALGRNHYDVVVTDMARREDGRDVREAGIELIRKIRETDPELQVVVYCGRRMADLYGRAAEMAGARLVTSSGTRLIAVLNRILGAADRQANAR
ncbi:response regulator [Oxalobacteraceae bacterium]|nr:response regulator [Oxalobacteraceae bacterium]